MRTERPGKFLEYTAKALEVPINDLGCLALRSNHPSSITSVCTVFAESEVISIRARGVAKEDIAAGLIASIALRVVVIAKRMGLKEHIAFVGGVAKNAGGAPNFPRQWGSEKRSPQIIL